MTISEIMRNIKDNYTEELMNIITKPDKSGRGYECPIPGCTSGTGDKGTGMTAGTQNPHFFQCWACGFKGDIFDIINTKYSCNNDAVLQIKKAEELLHREFLNTDNNYTWNKRETPKKAEKENKNMIQNNDLKTGETLVEKAKKEAEQGEQERRNLLFIKSCHEALPGSVDGLAYLKLRGISENTAFKYQLGYTPKYYGEMNTPAIIIPKYVKGRGLVSYTARSVENIKAKVRKNKGEQGIFNLQALQNPGAVIFLVEGEFDALSIIEAGYPAISTGGNTDTETLIKIIVENKDNNPEKFIILPDNDRAGDGSPDEGENKGYVKGLKLKDALTRAGVNVGMIDTRQWNPDIKDCNDYLVKDRAGFVKLLRGIAEPIRQETLRKLGRSSDYIAAFTDHICGKTAPISTGFETVDKLIDGGLHPGLIIVGAISSLGKTTFVLNLMDNMATMGESVILFSLEMSRYELFSKSISRKTFEYCKRNNKSIRYAKTNLGVSDFDRYGDRVDRNGNFIQGYSDTEKDVIFECMEDFQRTITENTCIVEGVGNIGTEEIRNHVKKYIAVTGRRPVVVVDYMQILAPATDRSTDKQNTDRNVVELKRISRDFNIPVIGISSFNRDSYSEPVSMKAYKESGAVEYTADILIGLQYHGMDYETYTETDGNGKQKTKRESDKDARRAKRIAELFENNEVKAKVGDGIDIDIKVLKNRSGAKGKGVIKYYPMFNCYREE